MNDEWVSREAEKALSDIAEPRTSHTPWRERSKAPEATDADRKQWSIDNKMNNECDCTADELFAGAHYSNCKWVLGMSAEELATTSKQII
jgi:hypothetical protein